jgi:flap endonuclease-1
MGLSIKDIIIRKEVSVKALAGKVLVVDAHNNLYQYLTSIRQRDGSPLTDDKGRVTSHLIGLFNRTTKLMEQGLQLAFVFDGKPPALKSSTVAKRKEIKEEAARLHKEAEERGDIAEMRKYATRATYLTSEMIEESKAVIRALGLPVVQAPSEGEAQAAYMVKMGDAYASVSQDFDGLVFGCPLLIRNLSVEGRKRIPGTPRYTSIRPEAVNLIENLNNLGIDIEQLTVLAILIGTDYNPGGVKGIGPKTALKLVKEYAADFDGLFAHVGWEKQWDIDWKEIFYTFRKIPVTSEYTLEWVKPDIVALKKLLIEEHNLSEERVVSKLHKLEQIYAEKHQAGLQKWF